MMVYFAYGLIIAHVFLGAFQQETSLFTIGVLAVGFILVAGLHIVTAFKEGKIDNNKTVEKEGWLEVCNVSEIVEDRAKIFTVDNERVAIYINMMVNYQLFIMYVSTKEDHWAKGK